MDPGHRELSQDADGPNSSPSKRAACAFQVQLPALDNDRHDSHKKTTQNKKILPQEATSH